PFPGFRHFGVIRMNPEAMVANLGLDAIAMEESASLTPKKYLVYLKYALDLPLPDSQWCRYCILPVATTLRPASQRNGITPDMVIPIAPNVDQLREKDALSTIPEFPFSNCYFWMDSRMNIRV
ncbi:hypothetical protein C8Q80DRAFT_1050456, partial [Daedaleopsis nitida]